MPEKLTNVIVKCYGEHMQTTPKKLKIIDAYLLYVLLTGYGEHMQTTPKKLKIIDAYLLYVLLTGSIQFVYCCLVGTYPFNSFLSGFISTVGSFILVVCLRLQSNPQNKAELTGISPGRSFSDVIFAHVILHFVVINVIG